MPRYTGPAMAVPIVARRSGVGVETVSVGPGVASTWGPFGEDRWIQVHGVADARVEYVIAPPVGSFPGVSPDRQQLPSQRTPIFLPIGCSLTLANVAVGTRAFTITYWEPA